MKLVCEKQQMCAE